MDRGVHGSMNRIRCGAGFADGAAMTIIAHGPSA
jgi:hypothetical protein